METDALQALIDQFLEALQQDPLPVTEVLAAREHHLRQVLKGHQVDPRLVVQPQTDEMLVLGLQRNFFLVECYNEFYRRFEPQVRSWLMYRRVEYHRAGELAQVLLVRWWQSRLHGYRPELGSLENYLRRAAYLLWVEKEVRPARPRFAPLPSELPQPGPGPEEELARREMEQRVAEAIPALPADQRAVLELAMKGMSHEAIAKSLGISKIAVYQLLFKARRTLVKRLGLTLPPTNLGRPPNDPPPDSL
jgi:RNA polymerase sigma factor (sigma-70 family)